jgi:hypothetical protein
MTGPEAVLSTQYLPLMLKKLQTLSTPVVAYSPVITHTVGLQPCFLLLFLMMAGAMEAQMRHPTEFLTLV